MQPQSRTREEAIAQSAQVLYEVQMLASLHTHFQNGDHDRAVANLPLNGLASRNALIESFQIHARQLIEFLTNHPGRKEATASDFTVSDWSVPNIERRLLQRLSGEFSQRVAHLSWRRGQFETIKRQVMTEEIFDAIRRQLLVFAEHLDRDRVQPRFFEDLMEMMFGQVVQPEHPRYLLPGAKGETRMMATYTGSTASGALRLPPLHGD